MKLADLKEETRYAWESLEDGGTGVVLQPDNFLPEVATYGDLDDAQTWIKAFAAFEAILYRRSCLDAWVLIAYGFNFTPDRSDYEYRHEVFEAFLKFPDALDLIKLGLEQLFGPDFTPQERDEKTHAFFGLVKERVERGAELPAELTRQLPTLAGETSRGSRRRCQEISRSAQGQRRRASHLSRRSRSRNSRALRRLNPTTLPGRRWQGRRSRYLATLRSTRLHAQ